jgi:hypothetical protein
VYLLVAVRSPDHHGLFVGDLAGGDGVDLLDVLDLGNGLHVVCVYIYECIYDGKCAAYFAFQNFFLMLM